VRVVVIRHHDVDSAGFLGEAFAARGASLSTHLFPDEGDLPVLDGVDHIVVLGSISSVNDDHPWIAAELDWLREADRRGVPVLGICFGGQALCVASGGRVELAPDKEIGWFTVSPAVTDLVPGVPELVPAGPWVEFHSDRCLPPPSATVLASNELGVQAFRVGRHLGVQFHPEVDGGQLKRWLDSGADKEAVAHGQDPGEFLAQTIREEPAARTRADQLVASALALAASAPED
jgi:GMP synthase-like glutamine amidotransferase